MITIRELTTRSLQFAFDEALRKAANPGQFVMPTVKPSNPAVGSLYLDTSADKVWIYRKGGWRQLDWSA